MPAKNESIALFFILVGKPKGVRRGRYPLFPCRARGEKKKLCFSFFLSIDFFPRRV